MVWVNDQLINQIMNLKSLYIKNVTTKKNKNFFLLIILANSFRQKLNHMKLEHYKIENNTNFHDFSLKF